MAGFWNWVVFSVILSSFISSSICSQFYDPKSFGVFLHDYVNKALKDPRTGVLYNVSLPSNFSGIEASFVRLRSGSFWVRGANFSSFYIPPRVIPIPYVKRLALVYENLGNFSSDYYQVPGFSFVAPVAGFTAYKSSNSSMVEKKKLRLSLMGEPILVFFPEFDLQGKNLTPKCVKLGGNGSVEFIDMSRPNVCVANDQGRFSIVIPDFEEKMDDNLVWRWWVLRFGCGYTGLSLLVLMAAIIVRMMKRKKMRKMEKESEIGVGFDTIWIGRSKMPSASMIRTQPSRVENDYVLP